MGAYDTCIKGAGLALGKAIAQIMLDEPRERAEALFVPGGPSVRQIESRIKNFQSNHRKKVAA